MMYRTSEELPQAISIARDNPNRAMNANGDLFFNQPQHQPSPVERPNGTEGESW